MQKQTAEKDQDQLHKSLFIKGEWELNKVKSSHKIKTITYHYKMEVKSIRKVTHT